MIDLSDFKLITASALALTLIWTYFRSGRRLTIVLSILVGIPMLTTNALASSFAELQPLVLGLFLLTCLHFAQLNSMVLRSNFHRALVGIPASTFFAGSFLAIPWAIAAALGFELPGYWLPYILALAGVLPSLIHRRESVHLNLDRVEYPELVRVKAGDKGSEAPLRIVQITDPHLGTFMSVKRLQAICTRAVEAEPDLIVLTGDYLTVESKESRGSLEEALAPLKSFQGRVFAIFGNHDLEDPEEVRSGLAANNICLLEDDSTVLETAHGRVQILGAFYHYEQRAEKLRALCQQHPRQENAFRLVLLHNPGAFADLPTGEGDLVLSGHTHGGQVGLVSLGLNWTVVSLFSSMPDHGFWARAQDRLYVHRGTGHYGYPIRIGVPGEESILHIYNAFA